jgi:hypothetical protein
MTAKTQQETQHAHKTIGTARRRASAKTKAPSAPEGVNDRPHRELTRMQEEVADLASEMILNGGNREDVIPFLAALYRRRERNRGSWKTPEQWEKDAQSRGFKNAEDAYQSLMRHWPEPVGKPSKEEASTTREPKLTTVREMVQADLRARLREQVESFLSKSEGFEPVWLLSEILSDHESTYSDLAEAISANVDKYDTYVRVYWRNADKVREFIKLIDPKESE